MDYTQHTKEQQKSWLQSQIADLERQHFEQSQFSAMAEAAADVPEPPEDDQSAEAQQVRSMRQGYTANAAQHRQSALEAERRIAAARAALAVIEAKADDKQGAKPPRGATG